MTTASFSSDIMLHGYCQVVACNEAKFVRLGLVKFKIFPLMFQDNSPILEKKKQTNGALPKQKPLPALRGKGVWGERLRLRVGL